MPKETAAPAAPANPMMFDKRVVARHIKKGVVSREDYERHLAALPDVADSAETIRARLGEEEPADDVDDDDDDDEGDEEEAGGDEG